MKLYKRCDCAPDARCDHPYWYRFWLHGREHRASFHTANRDLAHRIAIKRQNQTLEGHEKLRKLKTVRLSVATRMRMRIGQRRRTAVRS